MAYCVRHCPDARLGLIELWGTVTRDQLVAGIQALYAPGLWDPSYDVLWDARRLSQLVLLPEDIAEVALARDRARHLRPTSRVVILAARDLDAEIATLLLRSRGPERSHGVVARTLSEALTLLGRPGVPASSECVTAAPFGGGSV